ncbi:MULTISPECIES: GNAT family N-acetyltransferase [unclassified Agarivorans]|uniref:GNAT family N-acetyltransferase n=1 Tax=unclassified Agarivorans TaxID=2636026 RepID=UPI0026E256D5|nr:MULTISPECIES: GNAT family N-acetyltransferase [unclassified Agarivorans]MDO6684942.1 GNAT family N-acetyltransferase [Agarivorans sp. 3_MG-2023]MDO6714897.1 GNAT family N-acetyltransferase [Agarivorans sp. 2_MG-2023]
MNIDVLELQPDHSKEYLALRRVSEFELPQYVGPSVERELLAGDDGISSILSMYASEGTVLFGAFAENKLVGVIAVSRRLSPKFKHRGFIWGMYIAHDYRKAHVGGVLLQYVQKWAKNHSEVILLWLQVTTSNKPAISFYSKYGFKVYGTEPQALYALDEFHDVHYMQISA